MKKFIAPLLAVVLLTPHAYANNLKSVQITNAQLSDGELPVLKFQLGGKSASLACLKTWSWKDIGHVQVVALSIDGEAPAQYSGFEMLDMAPPESALQFGVGSDCAKDLGELKSNLDKANGSAMIMGINDEAFGVRPAFFLNTKNAKSLDDLQKQEEAFAGSDSH
ncbi:MAG: hypothetical protein ACXVB9_14925 [Bdellovibrionota bacterium]